MRSHRAAASAKALLLTALFAAAAVVGACSLRESTAVERDRSKQDESVNPVTARAARLTEEGEDVPPDPTDAKAHVDFVQNYSTPILIDIEMSGWLSRTNKYNNQVDYIGPGGYSNCNSGATVLRWNGGGGWWVTNVCTNGTSPVYGSAAMVGAVYAERGAMSTTCGQGPAPCFTYGGNIHVKLTPRAGTLSLSCTPAEITTTANVHCTATSSLPNYTSNIVWTWADQSPNSYQQSCGLECWFMTSWAGTVTVTATVNGEVKTATASIRRRCITGDSVIDANGERRSHLAGVWASGGDRDSTGSLIPVANRREVGQLGRPGTVWVPQIRSSDSTPCHFNYDVPPGGFTDWIHSHPWEAGVSLPNSCWGNPRSGNSLTGAGLSQDDAFGAAYVFGFYRTPFRVFAIDRDSIYYIDGSLVGGIDSTVRNGQTRYELHDRTGYRAHIVRYARQGSFGCTLP